MLKHFCLLPFAFCLLLFGCTRSEPPADLVLVNGAEPDSLDPAIISTQTEMRVVKALFEGLTRLEGTNATPEPAIAHRWDISPDGTVYTFHLRTNAVWSTGQPITADDFVWSWRRAVDPRTGADYAGQLFYVKNGEAINTNGITDLTQLGIHALEALAPTIPGAALCRAHADDPTYTGLQVALKGGQMGSPDYFGWIRDGGGDATR